MITWNLNEPEADFILATLNGQPQNWTVMARAELIQKLMYQAQEKIPYPTEPTPGGVVNTDLLVKGTDD